MDEKGIVDQIVEALGEGFRAPTAKAGRGHWVYHMSETGVPNEFKLLFTDPPTKCRVMKTEEFGRGDLCMVPLGVFPVEVVPSVIRLEV